MSSASAPPYDTILKLCSQAGEAPWYPGEFAQSMGIDKRKFDGPLDDLRLAGLIEQSDWQTGKGQGYRLTRDGQAVVASPKALALVRDGQLPRFAPRQELAEPELDHDSPASHTNAVRADFQNSARPVVTYLILAANIGMFLIAMGLAHNGKQSIKDFLTRGNAEARHLTGGLTGADILNGQWWRLLTTGFVHLDLFHLLINMSTFMSFGPRAEQMWGRWRFLLIYLVSGFGSVCVTLWHNPTVAPLGASGALCGIMLATAAWFALNRAHLPREVVRTGIQRVGMAFIWWMIWIGLLSWFGNLKFWWAGHVAGAVCGIIAAVPLNIQRYLASPIRWSFLVLVLLVPIVCLGLVVHSKNTDPRWKREVAEQAKEQRADRELKTLNERLSPAIHKSVRFMNNSWDDLEAALRILEAKRDEETLSKARTRLREAREQIDQTQDLIDKTGPFEVERVEEAVKAARNFLTEQKKLIEMTERAIEADQRTEEDRKALKVQVEQTKKMQRIYDKK